MDIGEFLLQVAKPLSVNSDVAKILGAYRKGYGLYSALTKVNTEGKEMYRYSISESDKYYSSIFNEWKKAVIDMPQSHYVKMVAAKKFGEDFRAMREVLKKTKDMHTKQEVLDFLYKFNTKETIEALEKYNPFDQAGMSWTYITNRYVDARQSVGFPVQHRLYLNIDGSYVHKVANYLRSYAKHNGISYEFKFEECADRADTMVIYCSDDNLMLYVNAIEKLIEQEPELVYHIHKPPVLTGSYKGIIGYGEEVADAKTSYNDLRAKAIQPILDEDYKKWREGFPKQNYKVDGKVYRPLDYVTYQLYMETARKFVKEYNYKKERGYLKPGDNLELLRDRNFQNQLFNSIKSFVYDNELGIMTNSECIRYSIDVPSIFERGSKLYYSDINSTIRGLYVDCAIRDQKHLESLRVSMIDALQKENIARSVVISEDTRDKIITFNQSQQRLRKVKSARIASNQNLYDHILFTLEKIAEEIKNHRGDSLVELKKSIDPLILKVSSFYKQIQNVSLDRTYSGSSMDYDERTQYYLLKMIACLKNYNVQYYEETKNIFLLHEFNNKMFAIESEEEGVKLT